jgi:hypothetical protein
MPVTGVDRLYKVAAKLPPTLDYHLRNEVRDIVKEPVANLRRDTRANIAAFMPSGYSPTFSGAFKVQVQVSSVGGDLGSVHLRGTARGRSRKRDSAALNRGVLRHKTWGRLPWHTQGITPGFWDLAADKFVERLKQKLKEAVEKAAKKTEADL